MSRRDKLLLGGAALYAAISLGYSAANLWHWRPPTVVPWTGLDRLVGFLDWTVWIYLSHFALQGWLVIDSARREDSRPLFIVACASAACIAVFLTFPTTIGDFAYRAQGLASAGFALVDWLNTPANSVPSMHVALAVLAAAFIGRGSPRRAAAAWLWAGAVVVSTMTAKQHTVFDVACGLAVAVTALKLPLAAVRLDGVRLLANPEAA